MVTQGETLLQDVESRVLRAMREVLPPDFTRIDPLVRPSERADFQANGLLALAKATGSEARDLAARVAETIAPDDVIARCEPSGPGFLNLWITDDALLQRIRRPPIAEPLKRQTPSSVVVIDYSQPNIAKEMHVGHLRSTIIGDALARTLSSLGDEVIRQNHLGDWGTQFGMLIQYLDEHPELVWERVVGEPGVSRLNQLYGTARRLFDTDPEFAERARTRVVALQTGDPATLDMWQRMVEESKRYFNDVYDRLAVLLTDRDAAGESFYNPMLDDVAESLIEQGIAVFSDGALCVFFDDIVGPDKEQVPLIVRKSDGGYGYAATDLAAIRYRVDKLGARRLLYVVDARQALHFRMVFATARRAQWLHDDVEAIHVGFGTVLGADGRPFRTRAGDTIRLLSLLDEAVQQARMTVAEKNPNLPAQELDTLARQVGIGAVKYADLSSNRTRNYVFDLDRMISLDGNTGLYLQYAHARVRSVLRRAGDLPAVVGDESFTSSPWEPVERSLALRLDELPAVLANVSDSLEPHRLCSHLYAIAQEYTQFYESCPILNAPSSDIRTRRLLLCQAVGEALKTGLGLLGIAAPDRL